MSKQNPTPGASRPLSRWPRERHAGFGLVQVMLILLLVGAALAAGALLLQSRKPVQQAVTQEETLRWADEAVAAFAAANARLPCPSSTVHGEEDCTGLRSRGWLPLRTLLGASGSGPRIGPVAYMVYRGEESAHLDLTAPGNAYQPPDLDGTPRQIALDDEDDPDATRPFAAVNTLDFCRSLGLAGSGAIDAGLAHTRSQAGAPLNVAYGVAAAGPTPGDAGARLDGGNASAGTASLEAPWREWNQAYDDRVRIRSFDGLAHAIGCRLLADADTPDDPHDVSLAAMDVLAAAVTVHDTLAALQENNVGNTEVSVIDAGFAQATAIAAVLLSAGQITDSVSTLVTTATSLTRAVATCIASLGATCWEVPLKATALGLSIGSVVANAVTLGLKIGAIVPTAFALDKSIEARDRAAKAALPPAEDLQSAIDEMACTLYGRDPPGFTYNPCTAESTVRTEDDPDDIVGEDSEGNPIHRRKPVYRTDEHGYKIPMRDDQGRQLFDSDGQPMYEVEYVLDDDPPGLDDKRDEAEREWRLLQKQTDLVANHRLHPWSNGQIRHRISESASWSRHGGRYQKEVVQCISVDAGTGDHVLVNGACVPSPADSEGRKTGDRERRVVKVFDWDKAVADAIIQRQLAERWADTNREFNEIDEEIEELEKNFGQWFDAGGILDRMKTEQAEDCAAAGNSELHRQKCESARAGVAYVEHCTTWVASGQKDAAGRDILVEGTETRANANCKPLMQKRIQDTHARKARLQDDREQARTAYASGFSPHMNYPGDWFFHTVEEVKGADGKVTDYRWKPSDRYETYWWWENDERREGSRRLPYYAPQENTGKGQVLLETGNLEIMGKQQCEFFVHGGIFGWGSAWTHGLYCQRYPYNRAHDDWQRARTASDIAQLHYEGLRDQFDQLKAEYEALLAASTDVDGGAAGSPVVFGAEPALERADLRGSVGPQPVAGGTP